MTAGTTKHLPLAPSWSTQPLSGVWQTQEQLHEL